MKRRKRISCANTGHPPHRGGMWIEIFGIGRMVVSFLSSPRVGGCGLKSGNAPEADSEESHPTHRGMCIEMVIDLRNPMRSQSSSAYGDNRGMRG